MFRANVSLGNINEDERLALEVQRKEKVGETDSILLSFHDAGRRRLRVTTTGGRSIGIALEGGNVLKDGDVFALADESPLLVVVNIAPSEAMALRLSEDLPSEKLFAFGVRLGHMLGNQHWPIRIERDVVLAPVSIDRKVMETVVKTHGFKEIEWDFVPIEPGDVPAGMPDVQHQHG